VRPVQGDYAEARYAEARYAEARYAGAPAVSDAIVQLRDQGFFNSDLVDGLKALPRFIGPSMDGRTVRARDYTACIEALRDARAVSAVQKASS
jgi:hypothetical protein